MQAKLCLTGLRSLTYIKQRVQRLLQIFTHNKMLKVTSISFLSSKHPKKSSERSLSLKENAMLMVF